MQNKMLEKKHLCNYIFAVVDLSFMVSYSSLNFSCIEIKLHNYIFAKLFYLFFKSSINKEPAINQRLFKDCVLTPDNKEVEWTNTTTHIAQWSENDLDFYFNSAIGAISDKVGWAGVNYLIGCINIKEHWLAIAFDMIKCKIYVFDFMSNYVKKELVDKALAILAQCIPSLAIAIGLHEQIKHFKYGP